MRHDLKLNEQLNQLCDKRDKLYLKAQRIRDRAENTRARVTSVNARIADINNRVQEIRALLKQIKGISNDDVHVKNCYFDEKGLLRNSDGTRSLFCDVDAPT